ncbi:MAG: hypothetical protein AAGF95_07095 [Chloroflexota bacterium]
MKVDISEDIVNTLVLFLSGVHPEDLKTRNRYRRLRDLVFGQISTRTKKLIQANPQKHISKIRETLVFLEENNTTARKILKALTPINQEEASLSNRATSGVDVLLVTATEIETQAIFSEVKQATGHEKSRRYIRQKTYYDLGTIGGAHTFLVQTEMGSSGPGASTLTIQESIQTLSPHSTIMVGIAFGISPKKQKIGDILVSKQLFVYESQRVSTGADGTSSITSRGDRVSSSLRLLDRFRDSTIDWNGAKVHFGPILSGEKLVDNIEFRNQLSQLETEALGGEMEGTGLYTSASWNKTDWILVKAICDWADGKKNVQKEENQQVAATNAAQFVLHTLSLGGFERQ